MGGTGEKGKEGKGESRSGRPFYPFALFALSPLLVFALAFGVRALTWQDSRGEADKVQSAVTANYKHFARLLAEEGVGGFYSTSSGLADPDTLGHPPGYPVLLALTGLSDSRARLLQIAADSLAAVLLMLIAAELLPRGAALLAGVLAALAPQFAWNSVLLLPDTLAALPVLAAVYCLARCLKGPRARLFVAAGALVGLSCWLRANALLLAPFLAAFVFFLWGRGRAGARHALAVLAGAVLVVAPLTLRNAVVFGAFIPVSLGAGQTLLEGIADYDSAGRFGIPATDLGIMRQEAEAAGRADYAETLFGPDALARDRARLSRGLGTVLRNPFWFLSVMARRGASMLKLERARHVSPRPQVTSPAGPGEGRLVWSAAPSELLTSGEVLRPGAEAELEEGGGRLRLTGDESKQWPQFVTESAGVEAGADYAYELPLTVVSGRVGLVVATEKEAAVLASSAALDAAEAGPASETVRLPFVSESAARVRLILENRPSEPPRPSALVGPVGLYRLGTSSQLWTRWPRLVVSLAQKVFITAVMLPLALAGLAFAFREGRRLPLGVLLVVPAYYVCVQSALHTEYRYVLALQHFLFALAAYGLYRAAGLAFGLARR
jgi:hypothetical protein